MHLIGPLVSGVRGAENGTATLYKRGTATRATRYADFYASSPLTTDVVLDANGGAEVYVHELVDVVAKDSVGVEVRSFTAGDEAPAVEVISQSFTGHDYVTAASGASKPTTLQAALDALYTSFGALDFNVLQGGASKKLTDALGAVDFYNVKSPQYGAVGDGVTDDTAAIQAAIDAAAIGSGGFGGVVFFPRGTFRVTSPLTFYNIISLMGSGANSSTINIDSATLGMFVSSGGIYGRSMFVSGLDFESTASTTGELFKFTNTLYATTFSGCSFRSFGGKALSVAAADALITCRDCTFDGGVASSADVIAVTSAKAIRLLQCRFKSFQVYSNSLISTNGSAADVLVDGCYFDLTTLNTGTMKCVTATGSGHVVALNNTFTDRNNPTPTATCLVGFVGFEAFNKFGTDGGSSAPTPYSAVTGQRGSRDGRGAKIDNAATGTLALESDTRSAIVVHRTVAAGAQALSFADGVPGDKFQMAYWNDTASTTGTVTFGANIRADVATFTVNAHKVSVWDFVCGTGPSGVTWYATAAGVQNLAE